MPYIMRTGIVKNLVEELDKLETEGYALVDPLCTIRKGVRFDEFILVAHRIDQAKVLADTYGLKTPEEEIGTEGHGHTPADEKRYPKAKKAKKAAKK